MPIAPRSDPSPSWSSLTPSGAWSGRDDVAREAGLVAAALELLPDVGDARGVGREPVVVAERVAEEVRAVDPALDRVRLVAREHHRQHDGDLRVDREARPERTPPSASSS